jgi:hypothetical protein
MKKYYDASKREELHEKHVKLNESLKGAYQKMLTESMKMPIKEEEKPEDTDPVDTPDVPAPTDDAPVDPATPEPVATDAPEGDTTDMDQESQMKTDSFIQKTLTNLPTDIELKADANGIFKGVVNDDQQGSFTVVVYPTDKYASIHDAANLIEPKDEIPAGDVPAGDMPPVGDAPVGGDMPPAGDVPPTDAPAGDVPPADVDEPKEDEELQESDEDDTAEQKLDESRHPTTLGKKDWKAYYTARYAKK